MPGAQFRGAYLEQGAQAKMWEWSAGAGVPGKVAKLEKRLSGEAGARSQKPLFL